VYKLNNQFKNFVLTELLSLRLAVLFALIVFSLNLQKTRVFPTFSNLVIDTHKNNPARLALREMLISKKIQADYSVEQNQVGILLETGARWQLQGLSFKRPSTNLAVNAQRQPSSNSSINLKDLSSGQVNRLLMSGLNDSASLNELNEEDTMSSNVSGTLELSKGLPISSDFKVRALYEKDLKIVENFDIDLVSGKYSLPISENEGNVIFELVHSPTGMVWGRGTQPLNDGKRKGPKIIIEPARDTSIVATRFEDPQTTNIYGKSPNNSTRDSESVVNSLTLATEVSLGADSQIMFRKLLFPSHHLIETVKTQDRASTYTCLSSDQNANVVSMSEKTKEAFLNLAREINPAMNAANRNNSLVFGSVTQYQQNLSGLTVEVENFEDHPVHYLNSLMIPDPQLKYTSNNGQFLIADLPAGFYSLAVKMNDKVLGYENVFVGDDAVTMSEVRLSLESHSAILKSFDAFSGLPAPASVTLQGVPEEQLVQDSKIIGLSGINKFGFLTVRPLSSEYLSYQSSYNEKSSSVLAPMISSRWLKNAESKVKRKPQESLAAFIGFSSSPNYSVHLTHLEQFSTDNLIYFDSLGEFFDTPQQGGGFIIFNLPEGLQSVVILNTETGFMMSRLVPSQKNLLFVAPALELK